MSSLRPRKSLEVEGAPNLELRCSSQDIGEMLTEAINEYAVSVPSTIDGQLDELNEQLDGATIVADVDDDCDFSEARCHVCGELFGSRDKLFDHWILWTTLMPRLSQRGKRIKLPTDGSTASQREKKEATVCRKLWLLLNNSRVGCIKALCEELRRRDEQRREEGRQSAENCLRLDHFDHLFKLLEVGELSDDFEKLFNLRECGWQFLVDRQHPTVSKHVRSDPKAAGSSCPKNTQHTSSAQDDIQHSVDSEQVHCETMVTYKNFPPIPVQNTVITLGQQLTVVNASAEDLESMN